MVTTFAMSYVYEILGRKLTLFISFFLTAVVFYYLPYTAPNYNYLIVGRCLLGVTMAAPLSHPLIADYIHRRSRGKAIAMSGVGYVFGEVIAMGVLFKLTKHMNFKDAFEVAAATVFAISILMLVLVKDPDMKKLRSKIDLKIKNTPSRNHEEDAPVDFE
jgi:MFS family permease